MPRKEGSILIIDDNKDLLMALKLFLSRQFEKIDTLNNPNLILSALDKQSYDVILLDMNFKAGIATGNEGIYWLHQILGKDPLATVVFITAYGDVELAVKSMKEGATDFIMKSWDEQKILSTLHAAYELRKSKMEVSLLRKKQAHLSGEIRSRFSVCNCPSNAMEKIMQMLRKVASTDASVLILGENGTGKEVLAREIHRLSARKNEIFVKVDLGAIPETLFESELFGHTKGAFTDAKEEKDGRFIIASKGTLFLDELGNLPLALQSKLLSAIQNREVFPLGSSIPIPIDVRIITATNLPLQEMISQSTFREDLYYRINAIQVEIPALRERKEDIPVLAEFFLRKYREQYNKASLQLKKKALTQLVQHGWPGNIRELEHCIEKGVILSDDREVGPEHLFPANTSMKASPTIDTFDLETNEKQIIEKALRRESGNIASSARKLGINRSTLYQKMKKYGL